MHHFIRLAGMQLFLLIFLSITAYGQGNRGFSLSPQAKVSLLTCGPGEALYEAFGHSAIRIKDPVSGLDRVYNYGKFNFNQPNFYLNFTKGYLLYELGTAEFSHFLYQYTYFNRFVHEQVLNLDQAQKEAVFSFLQHNSLPENKSYYYDYFFDNCATRPRDVFIEVLGDALQFDYSYADSLNYSIRGLTDRYIEEPDQYAWGDLGIDLGLGAGIDRQATAFEYMYQPEFLALAFEHATLREADGGLRPFVAETKTLYEPIHDEQAAGAIAFRPALVFWLLFVLVALATGLELRQKKNRLVAFDVLLFGVAGILGSLMVFLWFFTNHTAAAVNWNLAWAWPTHLVAALMLLTSYRPAFLKAYFTASAIGTMVLLLFWPFVPQDLHEALIPLLLLIIMRSLVTAAGHRRPAKAVEQAYATTGRALQAQAE